MMSSGKDTPMDHLSDEESSGEEASKPKIVESAQTETQEVDINHPLRYVRQILRPQ